MEFCDRASRGGLWPQANQGLLCIGQRPRGRPLEDSDADLERSSRALTTGIAEPATMKQSAESSTRLADLQHGNGRWSLRSSGNFGLAFERGWSFAGPSE